MFGSPPSARILFATSSTEALASASSNSSCSGVNRAAHDGRGKLHVAPGALECSHGHTKRVGPIETQESHGGAEDERTFDLADSRTSSPDRIELPGMFAPITAHRPDTGTPLNRDG